MATELLDQESSKSVAKVEADVSDMKSKVTTMQGLLTAIFQQLTNVGAGFAQPTPTMNTQMNEIGSNVVHGPSPTTSPNFSCLFDSVNAPASTPKVTLLDRNGASVAKGFLVTDATSEICHGRCVLSSEKKVYVNDVLVPDVVVYDGPQNGQYTLESFVEYGFLIWLESRLRHS